MKKYFLSLLVLGLIFVGFSNAQFIEEQNITCVGTYAGGCSPVTYVQGDTLTVCIPDRTYNGRINLNWFCKVAGSNFNRDCEGLPAGNYYTLKNGCGTFTSTGVVGIGIRGASVGNFSYMVPTNKMPVSALTPAINGLRGTVY